jgi:hypothetical protein
MKSVVGILHSPSAVEGTVTELRRIGLDEKQINVLTPATDGTTVPTTETEQPGMGAAIGGVVGGGLGAASGMALGAAVASIALPGVGTILALGVASAAILGAGGAIGGAIAGGALESAMANGLPVDELFLYEHALRQGHTVVIVFARDSQEAEHAREVFQSVGAESVDAARENWWVGLRDAERLDYAEQYGDFHSDERTFRMGFEAALHPLARGKSYTTATEHLRRLYPEYYRLEVFRRGYERGQIHYQQLLNRGSR